MTSPDGEETTPAALEIEVGTKQMRLVERLFGDVVV